MNQDVQGEPFNKHSWSDGMKTVSIYTELDELIATSERERRMLRSERVPYSESADHTTSAVDRPRVCAEGGALLFHLPSLMHYQTTLSTVKRATMQHTKKRNRKRKTK